LVNIPPIPPISRSKYQYAKNMQDILRESIFGQAVNRVSRGRYLPYPEDRPTFQIPPHFVLSPQQKQQQQQPQPSNDDSEKSDLVPTPRNGSVDKIGVLSPLPADASAEDIERQALSDARAQAAVERRELRVDKEGVEESKDVHLVGWYSDDDPDNPQ
jgi:DHA1 family multidrug resistance protein-like MFS transporter